MIGMSEREYAARAGISRGSVQKHKAAGRLVLHPDGSINAAASDARRIGMTDPSQSSFRPVPDAAVEAVDETLHEPAAEAGPRETTFLRARTAHEVLKAQERRLKLAKAKGELVDRDRAVALVFRLAREERDAWVTWPARVAALMAADLTAALGANPVSTITMQQILEAHVRAHLSELAEPKIAI